MHYFSIGIILMTLPVSYLMLRTLLKNETSLKKKDWLHGIPFLLYFLILIPFHLNEEAGLLINTIFQNSLLVSIALLILVNAEFLLRNYDSTLFSSNQNELDIKRTLVASNLLGMTNSTMEANIFLDKNYQVLYYNTLAEKNISQIFKEELLKGDNLKEYIPSIVLGRFIDSFEKALLGNFVSFDIQGPCEQLDLAEWFKISMSPIYKENKILIGISLKLTNINKIKKLEINNQEYINKLEKIAWYQAHVIRAPIANLIGLSRILKKNKFVEDESKRTLYISYVHKEVERLYNNINEITNSNHQTLLENFKPSKVKDNARSLV